MRKGTLWTHEINLKKGINMKKRILWTEDINLADWIDDDGNMMTYDEARELNDIYLEDICYEFNGVVANEIICIANVGRWDGRRDGYKLLGGRLSNIFRGFDNGYMEFSYDKRNVYGIERHHDGVNYYTYRELKGDTHDERVRNAEKLFSKPLTVRRIGYYTRSLAPRIIEVYGW